MVGRLRTLFARRAYIFKKSVHPILEHRELPEWIPTSDVSTSSLRHGSFTSMRSKSGFNRNDAVSCLRVAKSQCCAVNFWVSYLFSFYE